MSNEYFPHQNFIVFDALNSQAIFKKLKELHAALSVDQSITNELIKDFSNIELIENLLATYTKSEVDGELNDQIDLLFEMINQWPVGRLKLVKSIQEEYLFNVKPFL